MVKKYQSKRTVQKGGTDDGNNSNVPISVKLICCDKIKDMGDFMNNIKDDKKFTFLKHNASNFKQIFSDDGVRNKIINLIDNSKQSNGIVDKVDLEKALETTDASAELKLKQTLEELYEQQKMQYLKMADITDVITTLDNFQTIKNDGSDVTNNNTIYIKKFNDVTFLIDDKLTFLVDDKLDTLVDLYRSTNELFDNKYPLFKRESVGMIDLDKQLIVNDTSTIEAIGFLNNEQLIDNIIPKSKSTEYFTDVKRKIYIFEKDHYSLNNPIITGYYYTSEPEDNDNKNIYELSSDQLYKYKSDIGDAKEYVYKHFNDKKDILYVKTIDGKYSIEKKVNQTGGSINRSTKTKRVSKSKHTSKTKRVSKSKVSSKTKPKRTSKSKAQSKLKRVSKPKTQSKTKRVSKPKRTSKRTSKK